MVTDRMQPHDVEAEQSVLGSLLIDPALIYQTAGRLQPTDFYSQRNRLCYEAMLALAERSDSINQVTVAHELHARNALLDVGGVHYLVALVNTTPTSAHIDAFVEIVTNMAKLRSIIRVSGETLDKGFDAASDPDDVISCAEELLFAIRSGRRRGGFVALRDYLDTVLEKSVSDELRFSRVPLSTGFPALDWQLGGGLKRSDLVILAARPSIGKSALALNIARHAAGQGQIVGMVSLEMGGDALANRLIATEASVDGHRVAMNLLTTDEEIAVLDAIGLLSDLPIYFDDTPNQTITAVRSNVSALAREHGLDLLIVDYVQLFDTSQHGREPRAIALGEISRALKGMSREYDIPVLACAQLNRHNEHRQNHRPMLSDLRESGNFEIDADIVSFLHREDKYISRDDWTHKHPGVPYPENIVELIIAKHRSGPVGTVPLYFQDRYMRFESLQDTAPGSNPVFASA